MFKNPKNELAKFPEFSDLSNEDLVNIDITAKDPDSGANAIHKCETSIRINGTELMKKDLVINIIRNNTERAEIKKYAAFMPLYNAAKKLATTNTGYVTGLRMYFAIDEKHKIRLFYRAVGLVKKDDQQNNIREYNVKLDKDFYIYDDVNNKFVITSDTSYIKEYPKEIEIKHNGNDWEHFIKGTDVESVTFSFQEIFALLHDNEGDSLSIYNAVGKEEVTEGGALILKHVLLLAPAGLDPGEFIFTDGVLTHMYANLVHLCPPYCNTMKIVL